jgi:putative FmdB family regulatory protein
VPTYSYRCTECDNAFDIHQSFSDDTLTVCPVCGGKLRKVFSPVGVTFNGSGFYRTDSRAKTSGESSTSPAKSEGGSSSGSSGGSTSTEKKPSTPAPSKPSTSGGSTPSS